MPVKLSVLIPVKNEVHNLPRCLDALRDWADEVVVVDSNSSDGTQDLAKSHDAKVIQFDYRGGWPKKRQWALDNFQWSNEWILLLDADEILTPESRDAIARAIADPNYDGYRLRFQIVFLGRMLQHGDTALSKLSLFRRGRGHFEQRLKDQDQNMGDMEVHEHVVVNGRVGDIKSPVRHENLNSLHNYIDKHNSYSTWEAQVHLRGSESELKPALFGSQAQRRRWLKQKAFWIPGFPLLAFLYMYIVRLGFLDGQPGLIYATFRGIQYAHIKAKIHESRQGKVK